MARHESGPRCTLLVVAKMELQSMTESVPAFVREIRRYQNNIWLSKCTQKDQPIPPRKLELAVVGTSKRDLNQLSVFVITALGAWHTVQVLQDFHRVEGERVAARASVL